MEKLNLLIQFFAAIGTISVAIVAIWGDWIRSRLKINYTNLKIEMANVHGVVSSLQDGTQAIYYHLKVVNTKSRVAAINCKVLLDSIYEELPNGKFTKIELNTKIPFSWTPAELTQESVNIRIEQSFDFVRLVENQSKLTPVLRLYPYNFNGYLEPGKKIRYSLLPYAENTSVFKPQVFEVAWSGKWTKDLNEMSKNITITEVIE